MTIVPDASLLAAVAAWTGAALLVVLWPPLWPLLVGAALVLAVLVVWDGVLSRRAAPIVVRRTLPARTYVGRKSEVALLIENPGNRAVEVEVLEDVPADVAPVEPSFAQVRVPARGVTTLRYPIRPCVRGDRRFGPLVAQVRSPLGLLRRQVIGTADDVVNVYPDVTRLLRPEALDPRRVFAAIGVRPARRRGEGMDFESLREYVAGDDPRRIDWAASARRGRPVTRLYQHERHHTVLVALDASRLMGGRVEERTKLDHAVDAALALVYAALASGDRVGMAVFDRELRAYLAPRAHRREIGLFLDLLRPIQPRVVEADYQALARALATRQRQRSLLVVLTDFVEVDAASLTLPLAQLARQHQLLLVAVRDRVFNALEGSDHPADEHPLDLYRRLVLGDLLREREIALAQLRRAGAQTLDLVPEAITPAMLNRYLAMRYGAER